MRLVLFLFKSLYVHMKFQMGQCLTDTTEHADNLHSRVPIRVKGTNYHIIYNISIRYKNVYAKQYSRFTQQLVNARAKVDSFDIRHSLS